MTDSANRLLAFAAYYHSPVLVAASRSAKALISPEVPKSLVNEISKWGHISKSPYSESYYSMPGKTWGGTPEGIRRVADHWNFESKGRVHCRTDKPVPDGYWALGEYHDGTYTILKTVKPLSKADIAQRGAENFIEGKVSKPEQRIIQRLMKGAASSSEFGAGARYLLDRMVKRWKIVVEANRFSMPELFVGRSPQVQYLYTLHPSAAKVLRKIGG